MKLYDLPRGSHFRLLSDANVPPGAEEVSRNTVYWLGNIDGYYSYCKDLFGNVVHITAFADVVPVERVEVVVC